MKQTTLAITALASLFSTTLGLPEAHAVAAATGFVNNQADEDLSIRQEKAIFSFAREQALVTTKLIEGWSGASHEERNALVSEFAESFFTAFKEHSDIYKVTNEFSPSLLMADTLSHAQYLLAEKGSLPIDVLSRSMEEISASLMRHCYEAHGAIVVPYLPQRLAAAARRHVTWAMAVMSRRPPANKPPPRRR